MYFERLAFPDLMIWSTLVFAGLVELGLALLFLHALRQLLRQLPGQYGSPISASPSRYCVS